MKYTKVLLALGLLATTFHLSAQEVEESPKWSAQLSVQQQDLAIRISYGQLSTLHKVSIRPFYSLDVQRMLKQRKRSQLFISGQFGFYNNLYHERWISAKMGLGMEGKLSKRSFYSLRAEAGLARAKSSDVQYAFEDGKWAPTPNYAKASIDILMGSRLDLGYRILDGIHKLDLVLTSQLLLHVDTSIESGLPMYGLGAGVRYHFH